MEEVLPRHSLTHLSSVLKRAGHNVRLVDLRLLSGWREFEETIKRSDADFVCVTSHTSEARISLDALRRAKRARTECVTVAGGIHWTMFPDQAIAHGDADFVIRGEGEIGLLQLMAKPADFPNVFWGEPPELDDLPFEDRELFPDYSVNIYFPLWDLAPPTVDILTGRGCPWNCRFCCGPGEKNLFTRNSRKHPGERRPYIRRRSPSHVLEELRHLFRKYQFQSLVFHDDQFLTDPTWTTEFCQRMHDEGYPKRGVRWWAASRADMICRHPEAIREMKEAGLAIVSIGFESFNDSMLQWLNKRVDVATNFRAARICQELGLDIYANVIFGIPREDGTWHIEDDLDTIEAIEKIRPRYVSPSYLNPIPGSWFYDWFSEKNLLRGESLEETGSRWPDRKPLRGVDYKRLDGLLCGIRKTYGEPWKDRMRHCRYRLCLLKRKLTRARC